MNIGWIRAQNCVLEAHDDTLSVVPVVGESTAKERQPGIFYQSEGGLLFVACVENRAEWEGGCSQNKIYCLVLLLLLQLWFFCGGEQRGRQTRREKETKRARRDDDDGAAV